MNRQKRTVLVVNDLEATLCIFEAIFKDKYNVLLASNGQEAMKTMKENQVDVVLLDIVMPVMNGYDVILAMKADAKLLDIPIIVTTGDKDQSERKALELGADDFIPQPYDPFIIKKRVENLIKKYVLQIEMYQNKALEAEKSNQAKTAFLSRISHDMRTPLNGMLGLTTIMKEKTNDPDFLQDLTEMELSGQYLLNLINDTLDVSRIESGRMELHPVVCDGRELLRSAINMARITMRARKIKFIVNEDELPNMMLYLDTGRVQQIIMNILGNAAKFTEEGGTVELTIRNKEIGERTITDEIVIKDNGIGMSSEFQKHIFEPFSQEDATRTSVHQGTGLGLTITKQLLDLMHGTIAVESEVGVGTTFTVSLTLTIATEEQIEEQRNARVLSRGSDILQNKRILLCEDQTLNAKIAIRLLESRGAVVEHVENGKAGVRLFAGSSFGYFDAILMDIRMPIMDGLDATRAIRSLSRRDARIIPIIAMTANAYEEDVKQSMDAGMDAHLGKPIQTETLYGTLEKLLAVERDYKKQKVLVVDDIPLNRAVMRSALELDFEVLEADNGFDALAILEKQRGIDALITDIQMPGMDGIELIRKVRSKNAYRHIAIIANTQFGDPGQEEKLLAIGANDFVYKPTTPKIVEMRVRNALRKA